MTPILNKPVAVALGALAWTLIGFLFALPALSSQADWQAPLLRSLIDWWSWGVIAVVVYYCDRALPIADRQLAKRLAAHVFLSVALTVLYLYFRTATAAAFGVTSWTMLLSAEVARPRAFLWVWPIYWLIAGGTLAMRYYRQYQSSELRLERLERLSSEARLQSLRLQLDPHFLFNALNAISSQTESNPRLAREMISHLGALLRSSLDNRDREQIPLVEEIAQLEHYLAIQRIRFGDRLTFAISIDDDVRLAKVPALILQPLVENAVRHGIGGRPGGGAISLLAQRAAPDLVLLLRDDGVGLRDGWESASSGVGLSITRQRLAGMYARRGQLTLRRRETGGTEVEIRLPLALHEAEPDKDAA
jgi:two-component sensor histidine kinase